MVCPDCPYNQCVGVDCEIATKAVDAAQKAYAAVAKDIPQLKGVC